MGRTDPESVSAADTVGGSPSSVVVKFVGPMGSLETNPVTYVGDTDALGSNPPGACPAPPNPNAVTETTFTVPTVAVSSVKTVIVRVHGPSKVLEDTIKINP